MGLNRRGFFKGAAASAAALGVSKSESAGAMVSQLGDVDGPSPPPLSEMINYRRHRLNQRYEGLQWGKSRKINHSLDLYVPESSPYASLKSMAPHARLAMYNKNKIRLEELQLEEDRSLLDRLETMPEDIARSILEYL